MSSRERISVFIDGVNLCATAKALAFDIDYKRLLRHFEQQGRLVRAYYYTVVIENEEYSSIRPLIDWLDYNGYAVVTKPAKEFVDSFGRRKVKGNMNIELAVNAMETAGHIDHMVLFSGDRDFRSLVEAIQRKGVRVSVISTITTRSRKASGLQRSAARAGWNNRMGLRTTQRPIGLTEEPPPFVRLSGSIMLYLRVF
jgi:uncharacterized LabA/DUF88 family protein